MRYSIQGRACRNSAISVTRGLQLRLWIQKTPQVAHRYGMETTPHHTHFKKQTPVNQLSNPKQPEWIRLPRAGERCPYSNLSRSTLNNLILPCKANKNCPPVKSSVVRQKGATRGVRLIHRASLMAYIEAGKETAFGQDAKVSSNGSLRSLKERLSAITGVQTLGIGGNKKPKIWELYPFQGAAPKTFGHLESTQPLAPSGSVLN
jgi:hypothetical protein